MQESYMYLPQLHSIVDAPHPYIALGDLIDISQRFDPNISEEDIMSLQKDFFLIQQEIIPNEASFIATSATEMNKRLEAVALYEVSRKDRNVGVVIIDRYIAPKTDHPSFFRLNVSRDKKSKQVNRPGTQKEVSKQYKDLYIWRRDKDFDEVVLMDDAVGTGSTLIQTINELKKTLPHQKIRAFTGIATSGGESWSGIENVHKATGVSTEYLTLQKASEQTEFSTGLSICNSRDMTILGGYIQPDIDNLRLSSPHFLPFSITVQKNFTAPYNRALAAELLFSFNNTYINFLEQKVQRPLLMQDLIDKGFGLPYSNIALLNIHFPQLSASTPVTDYFTQSHDVFLKNMSEILQEVSHPQRKKGIID